VKKKLLRTMPTNHDNTKGVVVMMKRLMTAENETEAAKVVDERMAAVKDGAARISVGENPAETAGINRMINPKKNACKIVFNFINNLPRLMLSVGVF